MIHTWKKQLLDNAEEIFQSGAKTSSAEHEALQAQLYEQIGRLKTELDWLKKKLPASVELRRAWVDGADTVLSVNQVWSTDITYIPMPNGFMYLTAVIDWYSRYVLSWKLSNTLDVEFCLEALEESLSQGCPEVFNTDQGVQFTSASFTGRLEAAGAKVSMDGKGRCLDNVFVERLWRTIEAERMPTN